MSSAAWQVLLYLSLILESTTVMSLTHYCCSALSPLCRTLVTGLVMNALFGACQWCFMPVVWLFGTVRNYPVLDCENQNWVLAI